MNYYEYIERQKIKEKRMNKRIKLMIDVSEEDVKFVKEVMKPCNYRFLSDRLIVGFTKAIVNGVEVSENTTKADTIKDELQALKTEIEGMDFDFGDFYDHTESIIEMVTQVIDRKIEKLEGSLSSK